MVKGHPGGVLLLQRLRDSACVVVCGKESRQKRRRSKEPTHDFDDPQLFFRLEARAPLYELVQLLVGLLSKGIVHPHEARTHALHSRIRLLLGQTKSGRSDVDYRAVHGVRDVAFKGPAGRTVVTEDEDLLAYIPQA